MSLSPEADDDLTVAVTQSAGHTVVHVSGEIDVATCERLRDAIEPHLGPEQRVVLDLSRVSFMDSSCLTVLLKARTTRTADGGSLILRNPSDAARRVLSVTGVEALFEHEEDGSTTVGVVPSR
jgi:stage II sporulation protein AA (anti-sigma F factor antagonist)